MSPSKRLYFFCIILLSALVCNSALAETVHEDSLVNEAGLSVHQVLMNTITRYPDFKVLQAKKIEIEARAKYANGLLPRAPAIGLSNQSDSLTTQNKQLEWEVAMDLPLWLPNQRATRQRLANDAAGGYQDAQLSLHLMVAGMLRDSLWNIAMAENQLQLANSRSELAQSLLEDVQKRVKAGDLPASDILLAKNEALSSQTMRLNAEAEVRHASYRYVLLTGSSKVPSQYEEALSSAEFSEQHPMLREASQKLLVSEDEKFLVMIEHKSNPVLTLNARNQRDAFDNQTNTSLGLRLQIPLESEVQSAPLMANAEMNLARAQSDLARLRYLLENAFHEAEHNLSVSRATLEISQQQMQNARESLRLARKAFALGESDLVNLLRIQAMAFEAEKLFQQNQLQLKWNIARYNQAVGELP